MGNLQDMIWIETRKAVRSKLPLWTSLGALFMPAGVAFLLFIARNPEISGSLGLVNAKANLLAYSATDWTTYLGLLGEMIAAGGFFLYVLVISWIFGREFADGTLKDLLAVPVHRSSILLGKFIVASIWSAGMTIVLYLFGLIMGLFLNLPGGSLSVLVQNSGLVLITGILAIASVLPFALIASMGRGYLLPLGLAVLTLILTNIVAMIGLGEFFPWAVAGLYAQGGTSLAAFSYWIVFLTGLAGMFATNLWWKTADQSR